MRALLLIVAGALVGGAVAVGLLLGAQSLLPARYMASVLLFAEDDQVDPDQLREELAASLRDPGFLPGVVDTSAISAPVAAELARTVRIEPAAQSSILTQLAAAGHDESGLSQAVDAVASALVAQRHRRIARHVGRKLEQLAGEEKHLVQSRAEAPTPAADLPAWARSAAIVLAVLDAERYGLDLKARMGLATSASIATQRRRVESKLDQLEMDVGGSPPVTRARLDAARRLAAVDDKLAHVLSLRQELLALKSADRDLRIVRGAQTRRIAPGVLHIAMAAIAGALAGGLCVLLLRIGRPRSRPVRDGPSLESSLSVRVIGAVPSAVRDYGERKLRPLAQTHPEHLAVDGLRSTRTALRLLASEHSQPGPVVMADAGETPIAGHILANLAMLDAEDGHRVLLVETRESGSVLSSLFTTGTRTTLSITMDSSELDEDNHEFRGNGRIRFVVAADDDLDGPPVPGAFISYFDRVYLRAESVERAVTLMDLYEGSIGVLAGSQRLPMRQWREARDRWLGGGDTLHALIQSGHRIDERAYVAGGNK